MIAKTPPITESKDALVSPLFFSLVGELFQNIQHVFTFANNVHALQGKSAHCGHIDCYAYLGYSLRKKDKFLEEMIPNMPLLLNFLKKNTFRKLQNA